MMSETTQPEILQHLHTRREYCRALLNLSRRQRNFIARGNYTELLSVVARKQRVLGRLDALRQSRPNLLPQWQQVRETIPPGLRDDGDSALRETETLLAELLAEEQFCTEQLQQRREATRRQLAEVSDGRLAHQAYGTGPTDNSHQYLDVNR